MTDMQSAQTDPSQSAGVSARADLGSAMRAFRRACFGLGLMSLMINVLYLTGSFFMLEIYDRVLPSRSLPTLVGLCVLAAGLYVCQGLLDLIRSRILVRVAGNLDEMLGDRIYQSVVRLPFMSGAREAGLQPLRDLDTVRSFLSGMGPSALFDLPWLPLYLAICFAFHPMIGFTALGGAIILIAITTLTERLTNARSRDITLLAVRRNELATASRRNAEAIVAMGMVENLTGRWNNVNLDYLARTRQISDTATGLGVVAKVTRMILQSAVLAVGAYLVINQQATAGIIIAGSILSARALAPVDTAIAHWKGFVAARQSWRRLASLLQRIDDKTPTQLKDPVKRLSVENLTVTPPSHQQVVVNDVSFELEAGQGLGVIGPSGSGKSSLVRALVGVWPPLRGSVRLDGAALDQWSPDIIGRRIGYLPQDVELFAGTIAQNIARFEPEARAEAIIAAATQAGIHDLIVKMRDGYDTQIGEQGSILSAGQAQRVALARALYGDPFLLVLDEPNSNLDHDGDEALAEAVTAVRARGGIVVVVAHRPVGLTAVDTVLVMSGGRKQAFGPKDAVLQPSSRVATLPRRAAPDGMVGP
jgi:ATP-binding cassette, subfamily C, type I secretion system permease/ATPase